MPIESSVREWIAAWGAEVAAVDMAAARAAASPPTSSPSGRSPSVVHGLDDARGHSSGAIVWPAIEGFSFRLDELVVIASADGCQAVAVVPWDSVGTRRRRVAFARPGRATVVLRRESPARRGSACTPTSRSFPTPVTDDHPDRS